MRLRSLPLLLLALAVAGCDSTDDALVLDADFYVGSWTLASVADDSGDRTAEIQTLLEDLAVDFESDRSFVLVADFPALVNAAGQPDVTQTGTYQAVAAAQTLSLLVSAGGSTRRIPRLPCHRQSLPGNKMTAATSILAATRKRRRPRPRGRHGACER